jgi:hypothetical protein
MNNKDSEKQTNFKFDLFKAIDRIGEDKVEGNEYKDILKGVNENVRLNMLDDDNNDNNNSKNNNYPNKNNENFQLDENQNFNKFFEDSLIISDQDYKGDILMNQDIDDDPEEIIGNKDNRDNIRLNMKIKNLQEAEDPRIFRKKRFEREIIEQNCKDQRELENALVSKK